MLLIMTVHKLLLASKHNAFSRNLSVCPKGRCSLFFQKNKQVTTCHLVTGIRKSSEPVAGHRTVEESSLGSPSHGYGLEVPTHWDTLFLQVSEPLKDSKPNTEYLQFHQVTLTSIHQANPQTVISVLEPQVQHSLLELEKQRALAYAHIRGAGGLCPTPKQPPSLPTLPTPEGSASPLSCLTPSKATVFQVWIVTPPT